MKPLNPNSMIQGRYLIVQPIGKGGMGEVYLAVDQRLGSAVALKRTFFSEDSMLGTAFEREARILARLRHPVLPKVIDHFAEGGDQFLVMEHISGDDIAKRLEVANKPFPVSWVMFWADQMLDALSYLHSHEPPIVHRDIKPQNLKLTDDNHIVLLDFGLSKDFDRTASGLNSASVAGYSPHFASMEQIRGTGTDARSDLFSLGATLYQMLANVIPPDALARADALLGGKPDPIAPLNELNSEVPKAISDVILKAVSIRQDERFSTASEMQKALRRAFNKDKDEPEAAPEPSGVIAAATPPAPRVTTQKPATVAVEPAKAEATQAEHPETETRLRTEPRPQLDATMKMDKPVVEGTGAETKASEQKTAVFDTGDLAAAGLAAGSAASAPSQDQPQPHVEQARPGSAPAANAVPPRPLTPVAKKKSSIGIIIGVLATIILVAGIGGGSVWFLSRQKSTANPTPTPAANTPASSPAPPKTPEVNQNAEVNTSANTAQLPPGTPETPANSQVPKNTTATPKSTPSRANTTPGVKPTPPKKKPDDLPGIVQ